MHPEDGGDEVEHSQKAAGGFLVARGQSSEVLEAAEKAFDGVALGVAGPVQGALDAAPALARNHGHGAHPGNGGQHLVGVVALVGQHVAGPGRGLQQLGRPVAVGLLAGAEQQAQRAALGIDQGVDFRAQSAAAAPEGLGADAAFFRPVAACWWARTMVESSRT